jgi:hypothetical protein
MTEVISTTALVVTAVAFDDCTNILSPTCGHHIGGTELHARMPCCNSLMTRSQTNDLDLTVLVLHTPERPVQQFLPRTLMSLANTGRRFANEAVAMAAASVPEPAPVAMYTMWLGVAVSTCGAQSKLRQGALVSVGKFGSDRSLPTALRPIRVSKCGQC